MSDALGAAIVKVLDEGRDEIHAAGLKDHMDTLSSSLLKACMEPETEIRLTYKTTAQAMTAWSWMIVAAKRMDRFDAEKSSAFDVELTNGSGIMFWTDEDVPVEEKGTESARTEEGASAAR